MAATETKLPATVALEPEVHTWTVSARKGSEVLVSPITDPGSLAAIVLNGLKPRLMDSMPGSYNVGPEQFAARITPEVTGAVVVHAAGQAAPVDKIVEIAHARGIKVLEDCAQAHFAKLRGRPVGTFGDIAAFSTMYRKAHMTGPSGGLVYAQDLEIFRRALAHADRGKPRWREDFSDRDPSAYLFPALNHNTDEISCAIGIASLARLTQTIIARQAFVSDLVARLVDGSKVCKPYPFFPTTSPFFYPVVVDIGKLLIQVDTWTGLTYELQSSEKLGADAQWTVISTTPGSGNPLNVSLPIDPNKSSSYYRFRVY
jgi:dTDP-4-amino-4,6-dideoxygalactose transaminase